MSKRALALERRYPGVIKGNWEPSSFHMARMLREDVARIKEIGVNTVSVSVEYSLNKDGTSFLRDENQLISNIVGSKDAGLAVLVALNFVGPSRHTFQEEGIDISKKDYLKISLDEYLKMTKDKPVGYIFIAWIMPGMEIKNRPAEAVMKEYFAKS